jgi:hypothetical protein
MNSTTVSVTSQNVNVTLCQLPATLTVSLSGTLQVVQNFVDVLIHVVDHTCETLHGPCRLRPFFRREIFPFFRHDVFAVFFDDGMWCNVANKAHLLELSEALVSQGNGSIIIHALHTVSALSPAIREIHGSYLVLFTIGFTALQGPMRS